MAFLSAHQYSHSHTCIYIHIHTIQLNLNRVKLETNILIKRITVYTLFTVLQDC